MTWRWDESLYAGAAGHYRIGRMPYPPALADALRDALGLDGTGRLLDVGCGPGALTLLLAALFAEATGVDADPDMLAEAGRQAAARGITNTRWRHLRAELLPADLGTFRVVTFAQSFHWMDQPLVAGRVAGMLEDGGAWVHVAATTHRGVESDDPLPHPRPPWDAIDELVTAHLVTRRQGPPPPDEERVMHDAGYTGPTRLTVGGGEVVTRTVDEIVSAVYSLSGSAPHLFGARRDAFDADLRALLRDTTATGRFAERRRETALVIWGRPPGGEALGWQRDGENRPLRRA